VIPGHQISPSRAFLPRRRDGYCFQAGMRWERPGWAGVEARAGINECCFCMDQNFNQVDLFHRVFILIQTNTGPNEQGLTGSPPFVTNVTPWSDSNPSAAPPPVGAVAVPTSLRLAAARRAQPKPRSCTQQQASVYSTSAASTRSATPCRRSMQPRCLRVSLRRICAVLARRCRNPNEP
jgi:hypothetical protein